jgi:ferric-dicitrate binding protein FerR (iron transport regulator)
MKLNAELITRFLNNECSREEAESITAYFEAHPEELDRYIGENEWKQFSTPHTLSQATGKQLWRQIKAEAAIIPRIQRKWYTYAAAAAIFTLLAGSMAWFISKQTGRYAPTAAQPATDTQHIASITNTGTQDKVFTLEDGSEITLTAGSTLEYPSPLGTIHRLIRLEGKALFKVAQEKGRPFTVAAGGLTTTALGTSFWIESRKAQNSIQVKLVTGKVVIKKDSTQASATAFQPVYLTPGQELVFDKQAQLARVSDTKVIKTAVAVKTAARVVTSALAFNQRLLPDVLHILESHFHTTIAFDETQLMKMKFSGNYTETDKIDDILNTVALINDLKLEKTATGYSITK